MTKSEQATTVVAKINKIEILIIENGDQMVPVKPICEALGIASNSQIERIKNHEILGSVNMQCISTGSDGKQYEMFSIPLKFVFGWLFTIDPGKVKPSAKQAVIKYQEECYTALYNHFVGARKFLQKREQLVQQHTDRLKEVRKEFRTAKENLKKVQDDLYDLAHLTYEQYREDNRQLSLFEFNNEQGNNLS